jgi:hypothetical protein
MRSPHLATLPRQAATARPAEQRDRDEQRAQEVQPDSGATPVSQLMAPLTRKAPTMGPTSVARPPDRRPDRHLDELAGSSSPGVDDAHLRHVERAAHGRTSWPTASRIASLKPTGL